MVVRCDGLGDSLCEVVPEVPSVDDLLRLGRRCPGGLSIGAGSVAADDLDLGVLGEPGGDGLGFAVGQHVDRAAGFQFDEDRGVDVPAAQGEVVDAEDPDPRGRVFGKVSDQAQHGVLGDRQPDPPSQTGCGPRCEGCRDRRQRRPQQVRVSSVGPGQIGDLFGELHRGTGHRRALEPPDEDHDDDGRPPIVVSDSCRR